MDCFIEVGRSYQSRDNIVSGTMLDTVQNTSPDVARRKLHILNKADDIHHDTGVVRITNRECSADAVLPSSIVTLLITHSRL